jgi:hypothetical protein
MSGLVGVMRWSLSNHFLSVLWLFFLLFPGSIRAVDVPLGTSHVEVVFRVDSTHVGLLYLKDDQGDSIAFDPGRHLWTITVLDTAATMDTTNLYSLSLDSSSVACDSLSYSAKTNYPASGDTSIVFRWYGVTHDSFPGDPIHVDVRATIFHGESDVSFRIQVEKVLVDSPQVSLFDVDFPSYRVVEYPSAGAKQVLAFPWSGHGNLISDPIHELDPSIHPLRKVLDQNRNPSYRRMGFSTTWPVNNGLHPGWMSLQFFSYYDAVHGTGLYAATTDTLGYLKTFHISGDDAGGYLECFTRHFPEDNDAFFGSTYAMPYDYRMRAFHGDWIDASKIYRAWLIRSPILRHAGGPLRYRGRFLAVVDSSDYSLYYSRPDTIRLKEQLGFFSSGGLPLRAIGRMDDWGHLTPYYEVYDYFCRYAQGTGDTIRPADLVRVIKAAHGLVGAYTSLRVARWQAWEVDSCRWVDGCLDDSLGTRTKSVVYDINGDALDAPNCTYELCMQPVLWQKKYVLGVGATLSSSLGANAIYTDHGGQPILCYPVDSIGTHDGHPGGGGDYYLQGMREMVHAIDSLYADPRRVTKVNEQGYDIKVGWYDYYANWGGYMGGRSAYVFPRLIPGAEDVPILPSVLHDSQASIMGLIRHPYSDRVTGYGKNHWVYGIAYVWINGSMPGFREDPADTVDWSPAQWDDYRYVRDLIRKRRVFRDYLVYGEWMRPPVLEDCDETEVVFWAEPSFSIRDTLPAILAGAYVKVDSLGADLDSLALFFTNYSDTTVDGDTAATCSLSVDLSDYGFSPDSFQVCERVSEDSTRDCKTVRGGILDTTLTLASDSTAVFEIVPY